MKGHLARLLGYLYEQARETPFLGTILEQYSSLRLLEDRRLAYLSVANLLDSMSTTIIVPLLPTYAEQLGASAFLIGIIFAAPEAASAILNAPFGHVADRTNRRQWIVTGMVVGALSVMLLGVVGIPLAFVGLRALDGVGRAMKSPATNAYIGDVTDDDERGSAFGAHRTLGMVGMAIGPAIGGALATVGSPATPFVVLGGATLLGGGLLFVALPPVEDDATTDDESSADDAKVAEEDDADSESDDAESVADADDAESVADDADSGSDDGIWNVPIAEIRTLLSVPVVVFLFDAFVSSVGTNIFSAFFALLLQQQYAVGTAYTGLAWSVFGAAMLVFVPVGGTVADRAGRKPTLILGKAGWGIVTFGLASASMPILSLVLLSIGGLASAFMAPAWSSIIYELAPEGKEGTMSGVSRSVSSAGSAVGPVAGGAVVEWTSVQVLFVGVAGIWALTALDVAVFIPETQTTDATEGDTNPEASD